MAWNGNGSDIRVLEEPTVGNIAAIDSNGSVRRPPSQLMQDEQDDDEEDDDEDKSSVEPSTPTPTTTKTKENTSTILTTTSTTTARQKQPIKYIENKTRRHVTFSKRRHGIMKKAYELSVLTGANILLLILGELRPGVHVHHPEARATGAGRRGQEPHQGLHQRSRRPTDTRSARHQLIRQKPETPTPCYRQTRPDRTRPDHHAQDNRTVYHSACIHHT